jgi:hypothetical protein
MMAGMSEYPDRKTGDQMAAVEHECLVVRKDERPNVEVAMRKTLSVVVAAAVAVAMLVGAALAVEGRLGTRSELAGNSVMSRARELMPEVVVNAEMPRLVMPTVEVRAFRTLAMSGSGFNVN